MDPATKDGAGQKNTKAQRLPKKLRGDAARISNLAKLAREAVQIAEQANARLSTMTRVISTLVERAGAGLPVRLSTPVTRVNWGGAGVVVACRRSRAAA